MNWHSLDSEKAVKEVGGSLNGLTEKEVRKRLAKSGKNILREHKSESLFSVFFEQFNSLLVWVLIVVGVTSGVLGHFVDMIVIGIIVLVNASIGFFQEYKAESIIEKLKSSLKYEVIVLRDGVERKIEAEFLVPGDIVIFDAGSKILADCRILNSSDLEINEAVLTGESLPVLKGNFVLKEETVLAERKNMLYAGTSVVKGRTKAIVVETGTKTEIGKLAELVQKTESEIMPLEKKINVFSRNISLAVLFLVLIVFGVGVYLDGFDWMEMLFVSVSLAIGAIPEGLPAIIAITLAVAVRQMYKVNVLIRRLPAAETLGRASIICTDKTGTLTEEELTVDEVYSGTSKDREKVLEVGLLCNNAKVQGEEFFGDPTEIALVRAGIEEGIDKKSLTEKHPRIREFSFDSNRKMMSIIRGSGVGGRVSQMTSYVKGAPLNILKRSTREFHGGRIRFMSLKRQKELHERISEMEGRGLRVLGMGYKKVSKIDEKSCESGLIFVGLVGMIDPPRSEVKRSIKEAIEAGIEIKVITGDAALTTKAIAKKIGLKGEAIDGAELEKIKSEEKWDEIVRTKTIFSRVTPQQKLKVVESLKRQGEVVAVTGDGVNDILALKRADIGVAMGKRGSDVARDSADMVLLDDNFASIVGAVRQGRRVFDNLKKSLKFLLAANVGEVFIVLLGLILGYPLIFLPLAILWINLVTDSLPALALAMEPSENGVMKRGPRDERLLEGIWGSIILAGILMVVSCVWIFDYGLNNFGLEIARTMAITCAIFFELGFAFTCKSEASLFRSGILDNKWLIWGVLVSGFLHLALVYSGLGVAFGFVWLSWQQLGISFLAGMIGLVVFEALKLSGFRR